MNSLHHNHHLVLLHRASQPNVWQKLQAFWTSLGLERNTLSLEPEIVRGGQGWWYAYESTTGNLTHLESEKDIDMWLDENFRNQ